MGKQMIYIDKDVAPLLKAEGRGNMSPLINDLLRKHYMSAPVGEVETPDLAPVKETAPETPDVPETTSPYEVTKSRTGEGSIDGRIEETEKQLVDGKIGGDQTDGAVWN